MSHAVFFINKIMTTLNKLLDSKTWTVDDIRLLLEHDSSSINEIDVTGFAPLHRLLLYKEKCTPEVIRLLIRYGANVNLIERAGLGSAMNDEGCPLILALNRRMDKAIIKELLVPGLERNESVICSALYYGNSQEVVTMLIEFGFPKKCCSPHPSILHCALESQRGTLDEGFVKMLLNYCKREHLNLLNYYGMSLLCGALRSKSFKGQGASIAKMLIDAGCSTNVCGRHPSLWVCATSYTSKLTKDVVELLASITENNPLNYTNELGENPVMMALKYGKYELAAINLMLRHFPKHIWNSRSNSGDTVLHAAVANRYANPAVIWMLIKNGAEINAVNSTLDTPLHIAVNFDDYQLEVIEALIVNKALINVENAQGENALTIAIFGGLNSSILQVLLRAGARIREKKQWSRLSLLSILKDYDQQHYDHLKRMQLLIKYALLDNPEIMVQDVLRRIRAHGILVTFAEECQSEIHQKLCVKIFPNLTLLQCLQRRYKGDYFHILEPHDVDKMCDILCESSICIYLDDIAARIGRSSLLSSYLRTVYTVVPQKEGERKVYLNNDSIQHLVKFCTNDRDILRLSLAFHRV